MWEWGFIFLKNGPIPASLCLFLFFSHYNFNTNWKKHRWCAWDLNPGPQDGRRRQNQGAMAATPFFIPLPVNKERKEESFFSIESPKVYFVNFQFSFFFPIQERIKSQIEVPIMGLSKHNKEIVIWIQTQSCRNPLSYGCFPGWKMLLNKLRIATVVTILNGLACLVCF